MEKGRKKATEIYDPDRTIKMEFFGGVGDGDVPSG